MNHAYMDGNKRISLAACETFLVINGFELDLSNEEAVAVWLGLAAGQISERQLAAMLRDRIVRIAD